MLLNILLSGEEEVVSTIPVQRLVFLVKHLIECLQSDVKSIGLRAEITKTLTFVLPGVAELYGSHWEDSIQFLTATFQTTNGGEEGLPLLVSSFRLFARLKSMAESQDANDDLQDAWTEQKSEIFNALASAISRFGKISEPVNSASSCASSYKIDSSTIFHQPRDVAVNLLGRLISVIAIEQLEDVTGIFHLLTAHSRAVQRTAYTILHRYIPQAQEQISFDVALSKTAVNLPDELVSLLLETPNMQMMSMTWGDEKMWTTIRSYLLSWKVTFDHFSNAVRFISRPF